MWQAYLWQYKTSKRADAKRIRDLEKSAKSLEKMIATYTRKSAANLQKYYPEKRAKSHWYATRARFSAIVECCNGQLHKWEQIDPGYEPHMKHQDKFWEELLSKQIAGGLDKNRICAFYCAETNAYHTLPYNSNTSRSLMSWLRSKYGGGANIEVQKMYWDNDQVDASRIEMIDKRSRQSPKRAADVVEPEYRYKYSAPGHLSEISKAKIALALHKHHINIYSD